MSIPDLKTPRPVIIRAVLIFAAFILINVTFGADYGHAHRSHDFAKPDVVHSDPAGDDSGSTVVEEICCHNSTSTAC